MMKILLKLLNYMTKVSPRHWRPVNLCRSARKSDVDDKVDAADMNNGDLARWALVKVGGAPPQHADALKIVQV